MLSEKSPASTRSLKWIGFWFSERVAAKSHLHDLIRNRRLGFIAVEESEGGSDDWVIAACAKIATGRLEGSLAASHATISISYVAPRSLFNL
jgi:hypothetical protein